MEKTKILMAMSGGVDSSTAAILLREKGYDLIGVTLRVYKSTYFRTDPLEQSINDATILADKLQIPYYVIDVHDEFEKVVVNNFIEEYQVGRTPNPCTLCNQEIKWKSLVNIANEFNCDFIATGHYAQIKKYKERYYITKGLDGVKDQSYFLWKLSQDNLKRTNFPLGEFKKDKIKKIAAEKGFKEIALKKESYDICFIPEGDYRAFINSRQLEKGNAIHKGYFVINNGKILGEHTGIQNYTIGQRKGLGIAAEEALYVIKIIAENNLIILGFKDELMQQELELESFNFLKYKEIPDGLSVQAKIRYKSPEVESKLSFKNGKLTVRFSELVSAITPGQSVVFYEGDDLIGGGVIS